ncbi:MAG: hypothetical protein ABR589_02170 [Chthoniobacterales bacterium]
MIFAAACAAGFAQKIGDRMPELKTTAGTTYRDVTINGMDSGGLRIVHSSGAATLPWSEVPAELRSALGYHPEALARSAQAAKAAARAAEPKARIGATPEEFQRAGWAYIGQDGGTLGSTVANYQRGNYVIVATFWGGRCHELLFMDSAMVDARRSAGLIMDAKELMGSYNDFVKTVLDSNSGGAEWREDRLLTDHARQWTRSDGQIVARYIGGGRLTLTTKAFSDAVAREAERQEKKSLEGM